MWTLPHAEVDQRRGRFRPTVQPLVPRRRLRYAARSGFVGSPNRRQEESSHGLHCPPTAVCVRRAGAVHRCQDDGNPSRQASPGLRHQSRTRPSKAPDLGDQPVESLIAKLRLGARKDPHGRSQQRRRACQPFAVLDDHGQGQRRQAERPARRRRSTATSAASRNSARPSRKAAITRFGSGWAWLYVDHKTGKLAVGSTPNQDSPLMEGNTPISGIDVWEHAYYLHYQNRRPDYVAAVLQRDRLGRRGQTVRGGEEIGRRKDRILEQIVNASPPSRRNNRSSGAGLLRSGLAARSRDAVGRA